MKIKVVSDLHLEFLDQDFTLPNNGADVLILSGDTCVANHLYRNPIGNGAQGDWNAKDAQRYRNFFQQVSNNYEHVLCVMGNHEHYDGIFERTESVLRDEFARYGNIHLLEKDTFDLDGIRFLGASFWTSMNKRDDLTMMQCQRYMNDYKAISTRKFGNGELRHLPVFATIEEFEHTIHWLERQLKSHWGPTIVIAHHAPSYQSVHPKYVGNPANAAFCDRIEHIMMDHRHILLWTHGHVHDCFDYWINNTRVFCNPMAYPHEKSHWDPNNIITIEE